MAGGEWIRDQPHPDDNMAVYEDEQLGHDLWMLAEAWIADHAADQSWDVLIERSSLENAVTADPTTYHQHPGVISVEPLQYDEPDGTNDFTPF